MTNTTNVLRIGQMPGRIEEFAIEGATTFAQALEIAGLDTSGYEVKADGNKVTDFDQTVGSTSLILLSKMVKGNSGVVRIGQMPGRIEEFALDADTTFAQALEIAGLDTEGYEVKADGNKVTDFDTKVGATSLVLLSKMVKGNSGVLRIGQMPGRIEEYALEAGTTFAQALEIAGLDTTGYEVKADGNKVTDFDTPIGSTSLVLLSKMVKGNK